MPSVIRAMMDGRTFKERILRVEYHFVDVLTPRTMFSLLGAAGMEQRTRPDSRRHKRRMATILTQPICFRSIQDPKSTTFPATNANRTTQHGKTQNPHQKEKEEKRTA
jgi:hypothetical protein